VMIRHSLKGHNESECTPQLPVHRRSTLLAIDLF
jgi:hypothetical protein